MPAATSTNCTTRRSIKSARRAWGIDSNGPTASSSARAGNSRRNRLTRWSNDPIVGPVGEAIYLFDEESHALWNPTPLPVATGGPVTVRHGIGFTIFERQAEGIVSELTLFVPVADPV